MSDAQTVRRSVDVEVAPDEMWELLVDDDRRATWFGGPTELDPEPGAPATFTDPDGTRRDGLVGDVEPGRRLGWTWWTTDGDDASTVEVELVPIERGTRVTVTEVPLAPTMRASACAGADRFPLLALEFAVLVRTIRILA